jgi:hypothetical protein
VKLVREGGSDHEQAHGRGGEGPLLLHKGAPVSNLIANTNTHTDTDTDTQIAEHMR